MVVFDDELIDGRMGQVIADQRAIAVDRLIIGNMWLLKP